MPVGAAGFFVGLNLDAVGDVAFVWAVARVVGRAAVSPEPRGAGAGDMVGPGVCVLVRPGGTGVGGSIGLGFCMLVSISRFFSYDLSACSLDVGVAFLQADVSSKVGSEVVCGLAGVTFGVGTGIFCGLGARGLGAAASIFAVLVVSDELVLCVHAGVVSVGYVLCRDYDMGHVAVGADPCM